MIKLQILTEFNDCKTEDERYAYIDLVSNIDVLKEKSREEFQRGHNNDISCHIDPCMKYIDWDTLVKDLNYNMKSLWIVQLRRKNARPKN